MSASFQRENVEPGEGDVGGDGEAEEGPDGEEHAVGGDEGEEEDAQWGENQRAVHHEKRIHKCKIGKPPQMLYLDLQDLVDDWLLIWKGYVKKESPPKSGQIRNSFLNM